MIRQIIPANQVQLMVDNMGIPYSGINMSYNTTGTMRAADCVVPMALGLGDGGEQNAPLGRAVIGGLIFATAATLFFVPTVFMLVNKIKRCRARGVSAAESVLGRNSARCSTKCDTQTDWFLLKKTVG